jgi:hypothetical protein
MAKKGKNEKVGFIKYLKLLVQGRIFSLDFFRSHWVFIASVVFLFWLSIANRYVCQTKVETIKDLRFELSNAKTERVRHSPLYGVGASFQNYRPCQ